MNHGHAMSVDCLDLKKDDSDEVKSGQTINVARKLDDIGSLHYISSLYQLCYCSNDFRLQDDLDAPDAVVDGHLHIDSEHNQHHRNNNREEIRRKLAMGSDNDDYYGGERTSAGRKPSLQTRLQSGMNLQICFMNETVGEQESIATMTTQSMLSSRTTTGARPMLATGKSSQVLASSTTAQDSPSTSAVADHKLNGSVGTGGFVSRQAKLQAEARMALAQAKQMAHMQMEVEKQRKKKSPIAEMVGIPFPDGRRKVSRHALCEMNVAQLQVIVNDLHSQIESLNEDLVRMLLDRDDLHMEQDSMLVDIEDLTRYVGAKDQAHKGDQCGDGLVCKPPPPPSSRPKTKKNLLVK